MAPAVHEAGHAVVGRVLTMQCGPASVESDFTDMSAGHAIINDPWITVGAWEDQGKFRDIQPVYLGRTLAHMAGVEAEVEIIGRCEGGDGNDRLEIWRTLERMNLPERIEPHEYEARLRVKTRAIVGRHRDVVKLLAEALLAKGSLTTEEINTIVLTGPRLSLAQRVWKSREVDRNKYLALKGVG